MGLAAAKLSSSEFQEIHDHIVSHNPKCQSMHFRQVKQPGGKRVLRYLVAMHATPAEPNKIDGMICGPGVFWHYQVIYVKGRAQLNVFAEEGPDEEKDRIGERFVSEIFRRIKSERTIRDEPRTNYRKGQFYLRRKQGGMSPTHRHCVLAIKRGVLNEKFVSKLQPWNLELVCP